MPVGVKIGEGVAARQDQVAEGEAVEEQQRQEEQEQRAEEAALSQAVQQERS
ncbi:MAG: hypothetical protein ABI835_03435 [Chloroflexota bacterium]